MKEQKGFTLVELLIAVAITAVISTGLMMTITQLFSVNSADSNRMAAVKQVENALHYLNRDVQMSTASKITEDNGDSYPRNFPLTLKWTDYTGEAAQDYKVDYALDANRDLLRTQTIDDNTTTATTTIVAHDIDDLSSDYSFNGEVLTVNLTASVEGYKSATESRTLQVKPRID